MKTFCRVSNLEWREVSRFSHDTVWVTSEVYAFEDLFNHKMNRRETNVTLKWEDLLLALPEPYCKTLAYGMTYIDHQRETKLGKPVVFEKNVEPEVFGKPMKWREHLDYETEVGVLLHPNHPQKFGFVLVNDWTDRGDQVRLYDRKDPAPGFTEAKSFKGALQVGKILCIGDESEWPTLTCEMKLNGITRQTLETKDCLISPTKLWEDHCAQPQKMILIATGTPAGVLFRAPSYKEMAKLLWRAKLSLKKAKVEWLKNLKFLSVGDQLEFRSIRLGHYMTPVTDS
jgi:2-keto-4-pentenoate hydratase/2-oxohepta-3-ene-1,7-dioic acid hydratase in catechol pathway